MGEATGWRPRGESQFESKARLLQNSFLLGGRWVFVLLRPSTTVMRTCHITDGPLLPLKLTGGIILIQKNITETSRKIFLTDYLDTVTQPNRHIKLMLTVG